MLCVVVLASLFSGVARADTKGIRGAFFDFVENPWELIARGVDESKSARFIPDGLLVIKDGLIVDFGAYEEVSAKHPGLEIATFRDRLIIPGIIDGHIHFPQSRVIAGVTGVDRNAPDYYKDTYKDTPESFYKNSKAMIEQYHGKNWLLYAISPRFAFGSTAEQLEM